MRPSLRHMMGLPLFLSLLLLPVLLAGRAGALEKPRKATTYYVDAAGGNDRAGGHSPRSAWKTLARLQQTRFHPGDSILFRRGTRYTGPFYVHDSGAEGAPIVVSAYGDPALPAPAFTNPVFKKGGWGNCIRIKGSYVVVEHLYFHRTAAYVRGDYTAVNTWDTTVWEMGALYIDKAAAHCIVRNNELEDCPVGIKSYGPHALIENNYLHDCNRVLKEWGWGPIGIWLGADHQEVRGNRIFNYRAEDPRIRWKGNPDGGADGGAIEIDDARYAKRHISIHHNYTRDCQGFLEVTWTDIRQHPDYRHFRVHHNVSDDYQQFVALWNGVACYFEHNTIIRRKKNTNDWGVFNITQDHARNIIRNNIIITEKDIPVFQTGLRMSKRPMNLIENNLYWAASGRLVMGREGPGPGAVYGDPLLVNYEGGAAGDFALRPGSPAANKGADAGYRLDFRHLAVPQGSAPELGAFELNE